MRFSQFSSFLFGLAISIALLCSLPLRLSAQQATSRTAEHSKERESALYYWQTIKLQYPNEGKALDAFFKKHSKYGQFVPELERQLIDYMEKHPSLFKERYRLPIKTPTYRSSSAVTISQSTTGNLELEGSVEYFVTANTVPNLMGPGAINRWKGKVTGMQWQNLDGTTGSYGFVGDDEDPLTFGSVQGIGYVYLHGKGTVSLTDGREVQLGTERAEVSPATAPASDRQSGPVPSADQLPVLANDYLGVLLYVTAWDFQTKQHYLKDIEPVLKKYEVETHRSFSGSLEGSGFQLVLTPGGHAVEFKEHWSDPLSLLLKSRGKLPVLKFRHGSAKLVKDHSKYSIQIEPNTEIMFNSNVWQFKSGAWQKAQ